MRPWRAALGGLAVVACCGALVATAFSAAGADLYSVKFRVTAVGGKRPPNITETRVAGSGELTFSQIPNEGDTLNPNYFSGTVVVELDILTPHPRTERITLVPDVLSIAGKADYGNYQFGKVKGATLRLKVFRSTLKAASCRYGSPGGVSFQQSATKNTITLNIPGCGIHFGQTAGTGRNSKIHLQLLGSCLKPRAPSGVSGKPLCGATPPDTWTGTWKYALGTMTLTQTGTSVSGPYTDTGSCPGPGSLKGTVTGSRLIGTWSEDNSSCPSIDDSGTIDFTLSGKSFSGTWRSSPQGRSGTWGGTCIAGPCLKN